MTEDKKINYPVEEPKTSDPAEAKDPKKEKENEKPKPPENSVPVPSKCPNCHKKFTSWIKRNPILMAPDLQALDLYPADTIFVYQVSSIQIQNFLYEKAKRYVPNNEMRTLLVEPLFTKKRSGKNPGPGHAYAALQVAMSDESIEDDLNKYGVYGRIGLDDNHVKLRHGIFNNFIQKYGYDRKGIEQDLKNYKQLERYEDQYGIDEKYLQTLKMFATPRQQKAADDHTYVIFAANPIKIFNDMFITASDKHNAGRIMKLVDVAQMDGGSTVMYTIHLHMSGVGMERPVDNMVKAMLRGGSKRN